MKTFKLITILAFLASIVSFTSCMNSNNENHKYASYTSYVTVSGSSAFDYTFDSDFGCKLTPTAASVAEILPSLTTTNAKRLLIGFDMADGSTPTLEAGKNYNVVLRPFYNGYYLMNYIAVPTFTTVDTYQNQLALDSLTTKNKPISEISGDIWAANGYVNAKIGLNYNMQSRFYLHTYFNSNEDIDVANNTLYLNLYYNDNSDYSSNYGSDVVSFELPRKAYTMLTGDSFNIVLRAKTSANTESFAEVGKCTIKKDAMISPTN